MLKRTYGLLGGIQLILVPCPPFLCTLKYSNMHTLVLSGVMSVWIFTGTFVNGALIISHEGSNTLNSTSYSLKCDIPGFSTQATLSRLTVLIAQCLPSGCLTIPSAPYSNRHDASGIYVDFSTLAASEDGIQWTCAHTGDTPVTFDVVIDFGEATTAGSTEGNSEESSSVDTLTIVGGVVGGVVGVGAASGLVVGGSKLLKKQASDKNDRTVVPREDDVEGGNAAAYSSADKPVTNGRTVVPGADDEKGGGTAAESSTVKPDKDTSNVEQKDNHTDDKKHKDTNAYKDTKRETTGEAAVTEEQITLFAENTA